MVNHAVDTEPAGAIWPRRQSRAIAKYATASADRVQTWRETRKLHPDTDMGMVWIQAKHRIRVGEEIRVNYGPDAKHLLAVPHCTHPPLV